MKNNKNGFTLIELIVVMAIIGVLVLIATPKFLSYTQEAHKANIINDIKALENKTLEYLIRHNDQLPNDWTSLSDNSILETAKDENKLYTIKGLADNVPTGTFKEVPSTFVDTKLKGKFYVNENVEIYYSNITKEKIVANDPSDFNYTIIDNKVEITDYIGSSKDVIIPSKIEGYPVITIGNHSFNSKDLKSIVIPDSVITIGDYAIVNNQIKEVTIPNGVNSIGDYAFSKNQLSSIIIPNSLTILSEGVFSENSLTSVIMSSNIEIIENFAFAWNQLPSIRIPDNVSTIGDRAFWYNQLTELTIGSNVTNIGVYAFKYNQLKSVTIGNKVILDNESISLSFFSTYENEGRTSGTYTSDNQDGTWTKQ